jgi:hypothetical protein
MSANWTSGSFFELEKPTLLSLSPRLCPSEDASHFLNSRSPDPSMTTFAPTSVPLSLVYSYRPACRLTGIESLFRARPPFAKPGVRYLRTRLSLMRAVSGAAVLRSDKPPRQQKDERGGDKSGQRICDHQRAERYLIKVQQSGAEPVSSGKCKITDANHQGEA